MVCNAQLLNITNSKPSSNVSWIQVQPVVFLVTKIYRSSNMTATLKQKAAKQGSNCLMAPISEKLIFKSYMMGSLMFQVVSGTSKPLLSTETCQKLGLLKLGSQTSPLNSLEYLARLSRCLQRIGTYWYQQLCSRPLSNTSTVHP